MIYSGKPLDITFDWNLPLMVFNEMYIFGVDQKSKMTATAVHLSCSGGHLGYLIANTKLYEDLVM